MEMRFIGSSKELSMFANRTYVPLSLLATGHKDAELDFWLDDVNGFQLEQVFLDEIPERRNGLPSHSYSYSYDGIMHIFPLNKRVKIKRKCHNKYGMTVTDTTKQRGFFPLFCSN